ncbi:MAG: ornithine carbamoyltransferase [Lentisphaeria bacterium]|nr:ornithine carbamoyltransferase [Lentisphaeria bacterium]
MKKDLLTLLDFSAEEIKDIFNLTEKLKRERGRDTWRPLTGKSIGLIFAKSSTRTRISFEVGVSELGGMPLYLDQGKMQVGRGESIPDTARVLSRYLHGIVIRTFAQSDIEGLATCGSIPVINALTDDYHPCQILADLYTMLEHSGRIEGTKLVFFGDGRSNIANSLINAARLFDFELVIAAPESFRPDEARFGGRSNISWNPDAVDAAKNADYLYTDVWVSMGFEEERAERMKIFIPYQVNGKVAAAAKKDVKFLHCLPAHRGEEVAAEVMDSPMSIVFDEAENRLHVQKAVMARLF